MACIIRECVFVVAYPITIGISCIRGVIWKGIGIIRYPIVVIICIEHQARGRVPGPKASVPVIRCAIAVGINGGRDIIWKRIQRIGATIAVGIGCALPVEIYIYGQGFKARSFGTQDGVLIQIDICAGHGVKGGANHRDLITLEI